MTKVNLGDVKYNYNEETNTLSISETQVQFDTKYELVSPKTGNSKIFNFKNSTGPEFDPETRWIYECEGGTFTLEVCNHKVLTELNAQKYLEGKLNR